MKEPMTMAKSKTLLPHHLMDQTNKVKLLSLDLLSFDKGMHKNRVTDTHRIIRERNLIIQSISVLISVSRTTISLKHSTV